MSNRSLLDRQISLVHYLTDPSSIFAKPGEEPMAPEVAGLDPKRLRLEAKFSFEKRLSKIRSVFRETWPYLESEFSESLFWKFARAYPPDDIGRYHNARQFLEFLEERWTSEPPAPPFLLDVARLELALAKARTYDGELQDPPVPAAIPAIMTHSAVSLLRCDHDIRPLFDETAEQAAPGPRETFLAVGPCPDGGEPRILEVAPALFRLLHAVDRWTPVADFVAAAGDDAAPLLDDLVARNLLHVAT